MTPFLKLSQAHVQVPVGRGVGYFYPGGTSAVLLCGPIGFEALCARQSWHVLASMLAGQGHSVLRIDYPGEGNALDRDPSEPVTTAAVQALQAAESELKRLSGAKTISLVAMRLGAAFAALAFAGRSDFDRIVLLEPAFDGRSHVRELKTTARILAELRPTPELPEGSIDICGFVFDPQTVAAITALKIDTLPGCTALHVFRNGQRALPVNTAPTSESAFDGFGAMNVTPTQSRVPISEWNAISALFPPVATEFAVSADNHPTRGDHFIEQHVAFGPDGSLRGVLCKPKSDEASTIVHMLNAGANSHIGWARMGTEHARTLAAHGIASLRYDFSGIGDSDWRGDDARENMYSPRHIDDAIAAVDASIALGCERIILSGLCSGGYVAFRATARDPRIAGVVIVNALRLIWHPHDTLEGTEAQLVQPDAIYREKLFSPSEWKRLLSGGISIERLVRVARSFGQRIVDKVGRRFGYERVEPDGKDVRAALQAITQRGAFITFAHSDRDQSDQEAARHFGSGAAWALRQPNVRRLTIERADHEVTQPWGRDRLLNVLLEVALENKKAG